MSSLLDLPAEILDQILSSLAPSELAQIAQVSRRLHGLAARDGFWEDYVNSQLHFRLSSPDPYRTFQDLYKAHHPFWFLTQHRLWFSDSYPHGKLLVARYERRSGAIEAYAVAARPNQLRPTRIFPAEDHVIYQTFDPLVQLDLNQTVIRLLPERIPLRGSIGDDPQMPYRGTRYQAEAHMQIPSSLRGYVDHLNRAFVHARDLPGHLCDARTSLWPPLSIPSPKNCRTRAASQDEFESFGHKPETFTEASKTSFRLRQRMSTHHPFAPLQSFFSAATMMSAHVGGQTDTFSTIDPVAYTPTPEKPWQGIYVGDYHAHGCEFLLVTQPDPHMIKPLPHKARGALKRWPRSTQWQALLADVPGAEDEDEENDVGSSTETNLSAAVQIRNHRLLSGEELPAVFPTDNGDAADIPSKSGEDSHADSTRRGPGYTSPFKGRLEAIKLTGDQNVPRGELTFVADDLGPQGLVGFTKEPDFVESRAAAEGRLETAKGSSSGKRDVQKRTNPFGESSDGNDPDNEHDMSWRKDPTFQGTRMVRSVGHVCEVTPTTRRESYIPTQLMLISPGKLAQWWMPFQNISFYERIDWQEFLHAA